jgi:hypothetical protein
MSATAAHVWVRHRTAADAVRAAGRLSAKYGRGRFAVVADDAGGDFAPFAVVSSSAHSLAAR